MSILTLDRLPENEITDTNSTNFLESVSEIDSDLVS